MKSGIVAFKTTTPTGAVRVMQAGFNLDSPWLCKRHSGHWQNAIPPLRSYYININFKGNCREAVEFYSQVFGTGKLQFMTFGEMAQGPDPQFILLNNLKEWIMHT